MSVGAHRGGQPRERGSAAVEFVLVAPLLLLLALAVVQVALLLHTRATLTAAASQGARAGALAGADPLAGVRRATQLAQQNVGGAIVQDVNAHRDVIDGMPVLTVRIDADVPLIGMLGPTQIHVEGHALIEGAR